MFLLQDLKSYIQTKGFNATKLSFFESLIKLLENNQLTVATLTQALVNLNMADKKAIFDSPFQTPTAYSEAALLIQSLFQSLDVSFSNEYLRFIIEQEPDEEFISQLTQIPYKQWQIVPFDRKSKIKLEHELKGFLGLNNRDNQRKRLADLLLEMPDYFVSKLELLWEHASEYLPQLLAEVYGKLPVDQKIGFVHTLLALKCPENFLYDVLLQTSPELVSQLVSSHPHLYFNLSDSMRRVVIKQLKAETIEQLNQEASKTFQPADESQLAARMQFLQDASFRYKEVRLSQTEQAINLISKYLMKHPAEYKKQFFTRLQTTIAERGVSTDLLQELLTEADIKKLFAKWTGYRYSRAAGVLAELYKLASFGNELTRQQLDVVVNHGLLPSIPHLINKAPGGSALFQWLEESIYQKVKPVAKTLISYDLKDSAIQMINDYLLLKPNLQKDLFFSQLAEAIQKDGLSVELLQKHLQQADHQQLFKKWTGLGNSRAAALMANLYARANFDKGLDSQQFYDMVQLKELPAVDENKKVFLRSKIREIVLNPDRASAFHLTAKIGSVFEEMQAKAQFLQHIQQKNSVDLEADYQNYLLNKGLELACAQSNPLFDAQGHVLLWITLSEEDYQRLLANAGVDKGGHASFEEAYTSMRGLKLSNPTLCNLDIVNNQVLTLQFKNWLNNDPVFALLMASEDRSSIIDLQEEMTLHVLLGLRVFEYKYPVLRMFELRQNLLLSINELVKSEVQLAYTAAYSSARNQLDYEVLNQKLDESRKKLAPMCRMELAKILYESYPDILSECKLNAITQKDFTSTTATGLDYFRTDMRNLTTVRISATDNTSHNKQTGANNQALRMIYRCQYNGSNQRVEPYSDQTLEARVPSIADIKSTEKSAIKDVKLKLQEIHRLFKCHTGTTSTLIYNLLTSLHSVVYDNLFFESPNKQRLSAEYILKGAHYYNLQQLRVGEPNALVYVQNIPVNQHTSKLENSVFNDVKKEATLMTDVALLATLSHFAGLFPSDLLQSITGFYAFAHQQYLQFLQKMDKNNVLFHNSVEGKWVVEQLAKQKTSWGNSNLLLSESESLYSLVVKVLFKMFFTNDYRSKQFGMLVQALSVFVEPISMVGCKSGNERYQGVSGRVELLKSISSRPAPLLSQEESKLISVLQHYVVNSEAVTCSDLQMALDLAYNRHDLVGAGTAISKEDQGAGSKVVATKNQANPGVINETNTNVAESGYLSRLQQAHCSAMQAHKGNFSEEYKHMLQELSEAPLQISHSLTSS